MKIQSVDRFIPTRAFIDFDVAYYKMTHENDENDVKENMYLKGSINRRLELEKQINKITKIHQRIFNLSPFLGKEILPAVRLWPCYPRKKPMIKNDKILDLPDFNTGFYVNTIDWGSNNLIATSVGNKVLVGHGFAGKYKTPVTAVEYENDRAMGVHWSSDGKYLGICTESGLIQIWDLSSKKIIFEDICCPKKSCVVTSLQWHPGGKRLVWGCCRGRIYSQSCNDQVKYVVKRAHEGYICSLKYSPKGEFLCSGGEDGFVRVWKGPEFDPYLEIEMSNPVRAIAWHPWRSGLLAVGEGPPGPSSLSLWNANTGVMVHMEKLSPPTIVLALDFNKLSGELVCSVQTNDISSENEPHSKILVFGAFDNIVDSVTDILGSVMTLLWSPDGSKLGTAGSDETLRIWAFSQSRQKKRTYSKLEEDIGFLALKKFKCTIR